MERKNIPVNHRTIAKKWYSFGFPRGGRFRYFLDASTLADAELETYLPAPAANTRLTFLCIDATKPVTINSSSKAPLEGSATRTVTLAQFQGLDLVSNAAGTEWLQHRHGDKIIL